MRFLLAALLLSLASPAVADLIVEGCRPANVDCTGLDAPYDCCTGAGTGECEITETTGQVGELRIRSMFDKWCWTYDNADGANITTPLFSARTEFAVCLNLDMLTNQQADATSTLVNAYRCPNGFRNDAGDPRFSCVQFQQDLQGQTATGSACVSEVPPGSWFFEVDRICPVGDVCQLSVEGTSPQRQ